MKVIKCAGCGRYIYLGGPCVYCGNALQTGDFADSETDPRAAEDMIRTESLINEGRFGEALAASDTVKEWMPDLADIYWLRLLAEKRCRSAKELVCTGFSEEQDPDFSNAMRCASGMHKEMFIQLCALRDRVRDTLKQEIDRCIDQTELETGVARVCAEMQEKTEAYREKIFSLWEKLEETEQSMYILEKDFDFQQSNYFDSQKRLLEKLDNTRSEIYSFERCNEDQFNRFQIQLCQCELMTALIRAELENMINNHPIAEQFEELREKRDCTRKQLQQAIEDLREYKKSLLDLSEHVEKLNENRYFAQLAADRYQFADAVALAGLETSVVSEILRRVSTGTY